MMFTYLINSYSPRKSGTLSKTGGWIDATKHDARTETGSITKGTGGTPDK